MNVGQLKLLQLAIPIEFSETQPELPFCCHQQEESPSNTVPTSVHLYHCPALIALLKHCMDTVTSHTSKYSKILLLSF